MAKPPLHNIDSLFQQKLDELPLDLSQQQAQWMALSQTMHRPSGWQAQLRKPWAKGLYMTIVALVPFGIFYLSNQTHTIESNANTYTPGSVTNSLQFLNKTKLSTQTNEVPVNSQNLLDIEKEKVNHSTLQAVIPNENEQPVVVNTQPGKNKDSVRAMPVKQEKPVTKKTDSAYIYWQ